MDPIVSQTARRQSQQQQQIQPEVGVESSPKLNGKQNSAKSSNKSPNSTGGKMKKSPSFSSTQLPSSVSSAKINGHHGGVGGGGASENSEGQQMSKDDQALNLSSLPEMSPYERYICSLAHMNEILARNKTLNDDVSAQETCAILIEHVMRLTANKRDILEKGLVEASSLPCDKERIEFQSKLRERVQKLRGKLDHASIVAYEVGTFK